MRGGEEVAVRAPRRVRKVILALAVAAEANGAAEPRRVPMAGVALAASLVLQLTVQAGQRRCRVTRATRGRPRHAPRSVRAVARKTAAR